LDIEEFWGSLTVLANAVRESAADYGGLLFDDEAKIDSFARSFRLQIDSLDEGSLIVSFVIVPTPGLDDVYVSSEDDAELEGRLESMASDITVNVASNMARAHAGEVEDATLFKYHNSLPRDLTTQVVEVVDDDGSAVSRYELSGKPTRFTAPRTDEPARRLTVLKVRARVVEEKAKHSASFYEVKLATVGEDPVRVFRCRCSEFIYAKSRDFVKRDAWALIVPNDNSAKFTLKGITSFLERSSDRLPEPREALAGAERWRSTFEDLAASPRDPRPAHSGEAALPSDPGSEQ